MDILQKNQMIKKNQMMKKKLIICHPCHYQRVKKKYQKVYKIIANKPTMVTIEVKEREVKDRKELKVLTQNIC